MRGYQRIGRHAAWIILGIGAVAAHAQQPPPRAVTRLESASPAVYEQHDDTFRRQGKLLPGQLLLPAVIQAESGRGYVQVQTLQGPVWLDKMDVDIEPPLKPASSAGCDTLATASDTVAAMVRGAGEGCHR